MSENNENQNENSIQENDTPEETGTESTESTNDASDGKKKLYIIEAVVAVVAVAVLGVCAFFLGRNAGSGSASENLVVSNNNANSAGNNQSVTSELTGVLAVSEYSTDITNLNKYTIDECDALVAESKMLKVDLEDGTFAYIPNVDNANFFKSEVSYTEDELEQVIYQQFTMNCNMVEAPADKTVCEKYDAVNIDFVGYLDGEAFEGGASQGYVLFLGSQSFIEGFEEGIIGMEVGETKDLNLTFPEQYAAELAGKDVVFTVSVNSIAYVPGEFTDEAVSSYSTEFTTADACREYLANALLESKITNLLATNYYVNQINADTVKNYYDSTAMYYESMAASYGVDVDTLLAYYVGMTTEQFKEDLMLSSKQSAMVENVYNAIAKHCNITVTDEEISELAAEYGYSDVQAFYADYGESTITGYLLDENVLDYLKSLAK